MAITLLVVLGRLHETGFSLQLGLFTVIRKPESKFQSVGAITYNNNNPTTFY